MTGEGDLLTFVRGHVRSVWALEILLLLRADPERRWAQSELVKELRASQMVAIDSLRSLHESALVMLDDKGCWRYQPAAEALDDLCAQLQIAYRDRPVAVINMIAKPTMLQSLADAFKFLGNRE